MGNHRLYLDKHCEGELGRSTKYWYDDELLTIEWRGDRICSCNCHYVPERTAVVVMCDGGTPRVEPLRWPRNFRWRALWMCGVPKNMRFESITAFEAAANAAGAVKAHYGKGWKIAVVVGEDGRERPAAGWMAAHVEDREIRRMVKCCAPDVPAWFVKKVLGIAV